MTKAEEELRPALPSQKQLNALLGFTRSADEVGEFGLSHHNFASARLTLGSHGYRRINRFIITQPNELMEFGLSLHLGKHRNRRPIAANCRQKVAAVRRLW